MSVIKNRISISISFSAHTIMHTMKNLTGVSISSQIELYVSDLIDLTINETGSVDKEEAKKHLDLIQNLPENDKEVRIATRLPEADFKSLELIAKEMGVSSIQELIGMWLQVIIYIPMKFMLARILSSYTKYEL